MFIRLCGTIFYTFWQTVDLVPDNVRTEIPTICTKGKRQHPWNSNHIFWFDSIPCSWHSSRSTVRWNLIRMLTMCRLSTDSFSTSGIAIGDVQPQSSVWSKHSPYFSKYGSQLLYILFWRIFDSNLTSIAVIPQAIVRWACDTHEDAVIWKCSQFFQGICTENFNHREVPLPLPIQNMQSASHPESNTHHRNFRRAA